MLDWFDGIDLNTLGTWVATAAAGAVALAMTMFARGRELIAWLWEQFVAIGTSPKLRLMVGTIAVVVGFVAGWCWGYLDGASGVVAARNETAALQRQVKVLDDKAANAEARELAALADAGLWKGKAEANAAELARLGVSTGAPAAGTKRAVPKARSATTTASTPAKAGWWPFQN